MFILWLRSISLNICSQFSAILGSDLSPKLSTSKGLATERNCHFNPPATPEHPARSAVQRRDSAGYKFWDNGKLLSFQNFLTFLPLSQFTSLPAANGALPIANDLLVCFLARTLVYPHTGGRDTLVLSCPHCGGLLGFGPHVLFSASVFFLDRIFLSGLFSQHFFLFFANSLQHLLN